MTWGRRKDLKIINEQDLEQLPPGVSAPNVVQIFLFKIELSIDRDMANFHVDYGDLEGI